MRLTRAQVIDTLKSGKELFDNGQTARFVEPGGFAGGHCNIFTFWWLRDKGLISSRPAGNAELPSGRYWHWREKGHGKAIIIVGDSASIFALTELCQEISADTVDHRFHIKADPEVTRAMEELKMFKLPERDKEYWKSKFDRKKRR